MFRNRLCPFSVNPVLQLRGKLFNISLCHSYTWNLLASGDLPILQINVLEKSESSILLLHSKTYQVDEGLSLVDGRSHPNDADEVAGETCQPRLSRLHFHRANVLLAKDEPSQSSFPGILKLVKSSWHRLICVGTGVSSGTRFAVAYHLRTRA